MKSYQRFEKIDSQIKQFLSETITETDCRNKSQRELQLHQKTSNPKLQTSNDIDLPSQPR